MVEERENSKCYGKLTWKNKKYGDVKNLQNAEINLKDFKRFYQSSWDSVVGSKNVFERFIFLWITFNSWLSLVAPDDDRNHEDKYLLHAIAASERFDKRFDNLFYRDEEFKNSAKELTGFRAIFRAIWIRNKYLPWNEGTETRHVYVERLFEKDPYRRIVRNKEGKITIPQFSPECAFDHIKSGEEIPCDWMHTIHMIYQIRCNLFHGGKTYDSSKDKKFVRLAFKILKPMLQPELEFL